MAKTLPPMWKRRLVRIRRELDDAPGWQEILDKAIGEIDLALQALRQQEGMVLVPRDLLTAAGLTLPAGSPNAKRIWAILNAASERDQRGAAVEPVKRSGGTANNGLEDARCAQVTPTQSAPHPTAAEQVERSRNGADGRVRSGDGGSHTATGPSPASAAALESARLEGIRLGLEEARLVLVQAEAMAFGDEAKELLAGCQAAIVSLSPEAIAAKAAEKG